MATRKKMLPSSERKIFVQQDMCEMRNKLIVLTSHNIELVSANSSFQKRVAELQREMVRLKYVMRKVRLTPSTSILKM